MQPPAHRRESKVEADADYPRAGRSWQSEWLGHDPYEGGKLLDPNGLGRVWVKVGPPVAKGLDILSRYQVRVVLAKGGEILQYDGDDQVEYNSRTDDLEGDKEGHREHRAQRIIKQRLVHQSTPAVAGKALEAEEEGASKIFKITLVGEERPALDEGIELDSQGRVDKDDEGEER